MKKYLVLYNDETKQEFIVYKYDNGLYNKVCMLGTWNEDWYNITPEFVKLYFQPDLDKYITEKEYQDLLIKTL